MQLRYEDYRNIGYVTAIMGLIISGLGLGLVVRGGGNAVTVLFLLSWGITFLATAKIASQQLLIMDLRRGKS
jgi:hypothetical protein